MSKIVKLFLGWRILLFVPVLLAPLIIAQRTGYLYTQASWFSSWANFDGVHYLSIAANGYARQAAFFPLFPLLIRIFSLGKNVLTPGIILSNLFFFVSLLVFYKLLQIDHKERRAFETIVFMLVFSASFFFSAVYSEGLFFLLLVSSFYFARKGHWFLASLSAMLLSATRIVGILILPALAYEFLVQKKPIRNAISLLLIPVGLISYAYYNFWKWGNWFYFISVHSELSNGRDTSGIILFPQTIYRYAKILINLPVGQYEWWIAFLELFIFFFVSFLLYWAYRKKVRFSYLIFSVLAFLLPVSSGTFSGLPRYVIILFPIYIALTFLPRSAKMVYIFFSSIILFLLIMFFSRGYFIA